MLAAAGIAAAHVTVDAPDATQGGYSLLTFRVPTESDTASTTKLTVTLPGLRSARTEPMAGWTAEVVRDPQSQEAVAVTWTAQPGAGIAPGQFGLFRLSVGTLPEVETLYLPAEQTYSDGEVVSWSEEPQEGAEEPEHPAPSIALAPSEEEAPADPSHSEPAATAQSAAEPATDSTARWLGGGGLVLGALGAALGVGATIRSRRQ
jgi:uncharacterized protein YcnI